jgi:hypothetical protein
VASGLIPNSAEPGSAASSTARDNVSFSAAMLDDIDTSAMRSGLAHVRQMCNRFHIAARLLQTVSP